ncbi:hypothetical protein [Enterococcus gilvus]|uniref:Uncharacterized protein n=1 Tax=Enterococcus gilvus ATCC BAA-350 TaxID=1158614 RepID=R2V101_9ENTE|nr:hypothetical protein [Enterococcus gilvus]EOI51480.1 hypothetical protein UKC_04155 [Enterococcus gilvus ATCC BAA-350]EOW77209.1 hypothetical protein I592_04185 [Enterococcus gilvus ATCC BAA-350]
MTKESYSTKTNNALIHVDFQTKHQVYNSLEAWRKGLFTELEEHGYTISLPDYIFPSKLVSHSGNLFELNVEIQKMRTGDSVVLFRNTHYEIVFDRISAEKTLLTYRSLLGGLDRALLEHKLEPEKNIIEKYFNQMKEMFCD